MTRELLDEVLAHPDDDNPRRVYADWLSERGDPRGELIGVQCELERRGAKDPQRKELETRELALLAEHGPGWIAELGLDSGVTAMRAHGNVELARGPTVMWKRGFAHAVKVEASKLAAAKLGREPIQRLVATAIHNVDLSELEAIPTLRTLRLRGGRIEPRQWAKAPILLPIEELILQEVDTENVARLAKVELPALRKLRLENVRFEPIRVLAVAPWIPALRELSIFDSHNRDLGDLLLAKTWRDLTRLEIESYLPDAEIAAIASSHLAPGLVHLELDVKYRDIGEATIEAFSRSRRLGKLQSLVLRGRTRGSDLAPLEKRWGAKLKVSS